MRRDSDFWDVGSFGSPMMDEEMNAIIASECDVADEWAQLQAIPSYCERFVGLLLVNEQGEELHTAERPFCRDMWHSCHQNSALWQTYIYQPWLDGILTLGAAAALFSGRQG